MNTINVEIVCFSPYKFSLCFVIYWPYIKIEIYDGVKRKYSKHHLETLPRIYFELAAM
jgi:hypothetical protein